MPHWRQIRLGSRNDSGELSKRHEWREHIQGERLSEILYDDARLVLFWRWRGYGEACMVSEMILLSLVLYRTRNPNFVYQIFHLNYRGVRRFTSVTSSIFSLPFVSPGDQDHEYRVETTSSRLGIQISRQKGVINPSQIELVHQQYRLLDFPSSTYL